MSHKNTVSRALEFSSKEKRAVKHFSKKRETLKETGLESFNFKEDWKRDQLCSCRVDIWETLTSERFLFVCHKTSHHNGEKISDL